MDEDGHEWKKHFFSEFTWCTVCNEFIWGITKGTQNAYLCLYCKTARHKNCSASAIKCPGIPIAEIVKVKSKSKLTASKHERLLHKYSVEQDVTQYFKKLAVVFDGGDAELLLRHSIHKFKKAIFSHPTFCAICQKYIWGLSKSGYSCDECGLDVHRKCLLAGKKVECDHEYVRQRQIDSDRSGTQDHLEDIGGAFTIHLVNGSRRTIIMQEGQSLKNVLKKICVQRGINYEDHIAEDTSGNILDENTLLLDIPGHEITFMLNENVGDFNSSKISKDTSPRTIYINSSLDQSTDGSFDDGRDIQTTISIQSDYEMGRLVGTGATSSVYKATKISNNMNVAIKIIDRDEDEEIDAHTRKEIEIMKVINHISIMKLIEWEEDNSCFFVVSELIQGCELFDFIVENGFVEEQKACSIILQLLGAVSYIHSLDIVHRDLKPENVMYIRNTEQIKLIDFGESSIGKKYMTNFVGTPDYMAPEVMKGEKYTNAVDMWSIGVIAYVALSGKPAFTGQSDFEVMANIMALNYSFPESEWDYISGLARNFIEDILVDNYRTRLTADQALEHPWILSKGIVEYCDEEY